MNSMMKKTLVAAVAAALLAAGHAASAQTAPARNPLAAPEPADARRYNAVPPLDDVPAPAPAPAPKPTIPLVGEHDGVPVVVQVVRESDDRFGGTLIYGNNRYPIAGRADRGVLDGAWQDARGGTHPLRIAQVADRLRLDVDGKVISLAVAGTAAGERVADSRPAAPPRDVGRLREVATRNGFVLQVPEGWRLVDNDPREVTAVSPDGLIVYGVKSFRVDPRATPGDVVTAFVGGLDLRDVRVLDTQRRTDAAGYDYVTAVFLFTGPDGVRRKGVVEGSQSDGTALVLHAGGPTARFEACGATLARLAADIRVAKRAPAPVPASFIGPVAPGPSRYIGRNEPY
ncbi:MAG TPA: hypothetical protein VF796_07260 [Humisphaera sp.]